MPDWYHENRYACIFTSVWLKLVQKHLEHEDKKRRDQELMNEVKRFRDGGEVNAWT